MKKTFTTLFAVFFIALVGLSSCSKSDDNDFDVQKAIEESRRKDSLEWIRKSNLIKAQASEIKTFVDKNMKKATLHDSTGIWIQVDNPGDDASYTYEAENSVVYAPTLTLRYKGTLLDGTVFDQTEEGDLPELSLAKVIPAWQYAILPNIVKFNGDTYNLAAITEKGFKKGAIIKIVTPSPWAYDTSTTDKIPANSPLYFEIEIVDIK